MKVSTCSNHTLLKSISNQIHTSSAENDYKRPKDACLGNTARMVKSFHHLQSLCLKRLPHSLLLYTELALIEAAEVVNATQSK